MPSFEVTATIVSPLKAIARARGLSLSIVTTLAFLITRSAAGASFPHETPQHNKATSKYTAAILQADKLVISKSSPYQDYLQFRSSRVILMRPLDTFKQVVPDGIPAVRIRFVLSVQHRILGIEIA
jgi:hypothetical protein